MRDLNALDPLPKLGAKVEPLNDKPLTQSEIKALRQFVFENSRWYDMALLRETFARQYPELAGK